MKMLHYNYCNMVVTRGGWMLGNIYKICCVVETISAIKQYIPHPRVADYRPHPDFLLFYCFCVILLLSFPLNGSYFPHHIQRKFRSSTDNILLYLQGIIKPLDPLLHLEEVSMKMKCHRR